LFHDAHSFAAAFHSSRLIHTEYSCIIFIFNVTITQKFRIDNPFLSKDKNLTPIVVQDNTALEAKKGNRKTPFNNEKAPAEAGAF
jgi:hypothetical protein